MPVTSPVSRAEFKQVQAIRPLFEAPVSLLFPLPVTSWHCHVWRRQQSTRPALRPSVRSDCGERSLQLFESQYSRSCIIVIISIIFIIIIIIPRINPSVFPPPSKLVNTLTQICVTTDERGNYIDRMPLHYAFFFLLKEGGRTGRMTTLATSIFSLALGMSFPSLNNESVQTE